jgi:hypothetical protein
MVSSLTPTSTAPYRSKRQQWAQHTTRNDCNRTVNAMLAPIRHGPPVHLQGIFRASTLLHCPPPCREQPIFSCFRGRSRGNSGRTGVYVIHTPFTGALHEPRPPRTPSRGVITFSRKNRMTDYTTHLQRHEEESMVINPCNANRTRPHTSLGWLAQLPARHWPPHNTKPRQGTYCDA